MVAEQLGLSPSKNDRSEAGAIKTEINSVPSKSGTLTSTGCTPVKNLPGRRIVEDLLSWLRLIIKTNFLGQLIRLCKHPIGLFLHSVSILWDKHRQYKVILLVFHGQKDRYSNAVNLPPQNNHTTAHNWNR